MRSASIAEWIIGRFTVKNRAASIVGDLVELKTQKGSLWFWLSVVGVVLSLTWRQLAAVIAALVAAYWVDIALNIAYSRSPFASPHTPLLSPWEPVFWVLTIGCLLGWMALFYAVIRYGFSDELTQFTLVWTAITTAVCYGWRQPIVLTLCIILTVCTIAACIVWAKWRRAALTLFVSMFAGFVCFPIFGYVAFWYHGYVFHRGMGHQELVRAHHSLLLVMYLTNLMCTAIAAIVCSRMHRRVVRINVPQPE